MVIMTATLARTRLAKQGNSTGLTLSREVLEAAHLDRGSEVVVEATEGRIVITPAASDHADFMAAFEHSLGRYRRTYALLAR